MFVTKKLSALGSVFVLAAGVGVQAAPAHLENRQINQGNLISALNNINLQIERLNALNNLTIQDVRVVNVENVLNNNRVLNNALNNNDVDVLTNFLNNSLNNNNVEIIKNALNNNNVLISDVIAINVLSGGDVVVFTR